MKKEERACKKLYERSIPYVYSIVQRYVTDHSERKDTVQEIFASVFKNLWQFDPERGNFKGWIRQITVNQCLMHHRVLNRQATVVPIHSLEGAAPAEELDLHSLKREDVERLLEKMPAGYRTIFMMVVIDEFSHEETSELLEISQETSRSQLSRAKKWIRKYMVNQQTARVDGLL